MYPTPFHTYYKARKLENFQDNAMLAAFASSDVEIYPYQIVAADFSLRSPYLRGCLLADECSLGKTYEALLIATQKWHVGKTRQMLILPVNMVAQWVKKIEASFTLPYLLMDNAENWSNEESDNPFIQDALVITTYDFAVQKADYIKAQTWDLIIFDEADCLNESYNEEKKIARTLKQATSESFKLLLTASPIEMDIRDIYGLIYFIDETLLPYSVDEFYQYYFRRPDRYPELATWVSKFCFRTLKSQVIDYVNFTNRVPYTIGCNMTKDEQTLYDKIYAYFMRPKKFAFPASNPHDLMMNHCPKISSSVEQITDMFAGVMDRLDKIQVDEPNKRLFTSEIEAVKEILQLGEKVSVNGKMIALFPILNQCFSHMRRLKSPQKAIVFVNYRLTQKTLYRLLTEQGYSVLTYSGENSRDYSIMERFRYDNSIQILIATDDMAKGLDIEFCPLVINYDMLTNATKLDQRISRCHRQGQQSDVLVVNMFSPNNYADVRYLELINKRILQFDGIFGMSDTILGNFDEAIKDVLATMRHSAEIQSAFESNLANNADTNRSIVEAAENTLFTTFTREIADKVTVTPQYIIEQSEKINADLWEIVSPLLKEYGYIIDEAAKTATLPANVEPQKFFYYYTGSRSKPYIGLRNYGIGKSFKPTSGRVTLVSPIGRGLIHNIECANEGELTVDGSIEPCKIALFCAEITSRLADKTTYNVLIGMTESGRILTDNECENILEMPVLDYTENGRKSPRWLKGSTRTGSPCELERLINKDDYINKQLSELSSAQNEEIECMKRRTATQKSALEHALADIRLQVKTLEQDTESNTNRIAQINAKKRLTVLYRELMEREEHLFLDKMKLDTELENSIAAFISGAGMSCNLQRQFILTITGKTI